MKNFTPTVQPYYLDLEPGGEYHHGVNSTGSEPIFFPSTNFLLKAKKVKGMVRNDVYRGWDR